MRHGPLGCRLGDRTHRSWANYAREERGAAIAEAHHSSQAALALAEDRAPVEQALIRALTVRYPLSEPAALETMGGWHDAHVAAMREVHARFPDDLDVAALFAEAMMIRTPWALWNTATGKPADGADTEEIVGVYEDGLARARARAFRIRCAAFPAPRARNVSGPGGRPAGSGPLRLAAPDAAHLLHMPSHIDVQLCRYREALDASEKAVAADRRYVATSDESPARWQVCSKRPGPTCDRRSVPKTRAGRTWSRRCRPANRPSAGGHKVAAAGQRKSRNSARRLWRR